MRTALLLVLAVLAGLPGVLYAACGPLCPARTAKPCCHAAGPAPTIKAPSCCEAFLAPAPLQGGRAVLTARAAPSAAPVAASVPDALAAQPLIERPLPALLPVPPLLHERVGLHTLHAVFLI